MFSLCKNTPDGSFDVNKAVFFRLIAQMGQACSELPMRHAIRPAEREAVIDLCEELWDEYGARFSKLAYQRSAAYAESLCSETLDLCADDAPLAGIFDDIPWATKDKGEL